MKKRIKWGTLIICIAIPLAVGFLASLLTRDAMEAYEMMKKPPLSPPEKVFPIVWTVLFTLMGISFYRVWVRTRPPRGSSPVIYAISLIVNFAWPIIYFNEMAFLAAFVCLIILLILVVWTIVEYAKTDKAAAVLQIPYALWLLFAGYLNMGVYLLNR